MTKHAVLAGLKVYVVGGAVRDELLGLVAGDRDWVVVGSTPEDMSRRGFIPVGGDFPVFLHPDTKEEYALARTERKSGRGYKGFTFYTGADVSLEDDLSRRDLTINAMARGDDGVLIDPFGGSKDVAARVFRHIGPAFEEDPVRVLRLARFAARFADFTVAPETMALCRRMVEKGEVDHLVPERVWQELARGLMSEKPSRMLEVLSQAEAASHILPEWIDTERARNTLDAIAEQSQLPLASRYAVMCFDTPDAKALSLRLKVPTECTDMARLLPLIVAAAQDTVDAERVMNLIEACDGLRKPDRFQCLLHTAQYLCAIDTRTWLDKLTVLKNVDASAVAASVKQGTAIKDAVRQARVNALRSAAKVR